MSDGPQLSVRPAGGPPRSRTRNAPHVGGAFQAARSAFRRWRRTRPFWGGFWCLLAGLEVGYFPTTEIKLIAVSHVVWLGMLTGILIAVMGLILWLAPSQRLVAGILAIVFSVASLLTSDYGGFLIGLIMGTAGGALGFAWMPVTPKAQPAVETQPAPPAEAK